MVATTAVGSWPPPFGQRPALRPLWRGHADEDDAEVNRALIAASRIAMDEMLACGIDQLTGGEAFAPDFVHTIPPRLTGIEAEQLRDIGLGQAGVARYRVTGTIEAPEGLGYAKAFGRERAIEPTLGKVALPSPYTIGLTFAPGELTDRALADLTTVVQDEIAQLIEAGVEEIQLDAPSEAIACAHDAEQVDRLAELLTDPFDRLQGAAGVRRSVHFCLGDIARKPSTQVQNLRSLMPLLARLDGRIDRALIECSYSGQWGDRGLLADVPDSIEIVAGIGDVKTPPLDRAHYGHQIEQLLEVVDQDRLLVSTSCGCGRVPHDEAIRLNLELCRAAATYRT